jgi:beta-lactamase class A
MVIPELDNQLTILSKQCGGVVSVAVRGVENAADFGFNEDAIISAASVIKVPIIVEALRQVRQGTFSLDTQFAIEGEGRVRGAGVLRYMHGGITLTLEDLLTLMIIVSDNHATNMVIDILGMDAVNANLSSMGYTSTLLRRKMMDWEAIEQGRDNVTTAREMADLLARIARKEVLGGEWDECIVTALGRQQDSRKLGLFLPDDVEVANKTGGREGIQNDCGIVTGPGLGYSIAVLTSGAKSVGDAILTIGRISEAVYAHLARSLR